MVDFGMGRYWSANQRRPRSEKENVDDFMDKETSRRLATAADVPPANPREFRTCSRAAQPQAMPRVGVTKDTHLFVNALATEEELLQL